MLCEAGTRMKLKDNKNAFFINPLNKTLIIEIPLPPLLFFLFVYNFIEYGHLDCRSLLKNSK